MFETHLFWLLSSSTFIWGFLIFHFHFSLPFFSLLFSSFSSSLHGGGPAQSVSVRVRACVRVCAYTSASSLPSYKEITALRSQCLFSSIFFPSRSCPLLLLYGRGFGAVRSRIRYITSCLAGWLAGEGRKVGDGASCTIVGFGWLGLVC